MLSKITFFVIISSVWSTLDKLHCSDWVHYFKGYECKGETSINPKIYNFLTFFVYKDNTKYLMKMSLPSRESRIELMLLKKLRKRPFISQLVDFIQTDEYILLIFKFGNLVSLEESLLKDPVHFKDFKVALAFMKKVIKGVKQIHKEGYIHANLKPNSIFVDENFEPVIFNFENVLMLQRTGLVDASGVSLRTPEMAFSRDFKKKITYDEKIDVFFLGAIFYEIFRGPVSSILNYSAHYKLFLESTIPFRKNDPRDFYDIIYGSLQTNKTRVTFEKFSVLVRKALDFPSKDSLEAETSYKLKDNASDKELLVNSSSVDLKSHFKASFFDNTQESEETTVEIDMLEHMHRQDEQAEGSFLTKLLLVIFLLNWVLFIVLLVLYVLYILEKRGFFRFLIGSKKKSETDLVSVTTAASGH